MLAKNHIKHRAYPDVVAVGWAELVLCCAAFAFSPLLHNENPHVHYIYRALYNTTNGNGFDVDCIYIRQRHTILYSAFWQYYFIGFFVCRFSAIAKKMERWETGRTVPFITLWVFVQTNIHLYRNVKRVSRMADAACHFHTRFLFSQFLIFFFLHFHSIRGDKLSDDMENQYF